MKRMFFFYSFLSFPSDISAMQVSMLRVGSVLPFLTLLPECSWTSKEPGTDKLRSLGYLCSAWVFFLHSSSPPPKQPWWHVAENWVWNTQMDPELVAAASCSLEASQIPQDLQSRITTKSCQHQARMRETPNELFGSNLHHKNIPVHFLNLRKVDCKNNWQVIFWLDRGAVIKVMIGHKSRYSLFFPLTVFICPCFFCSSQIAQNGNSDARW